MVEIKKYCIAICVAGIAAFSVGAQQIKPRIEGLETDSVYMALLAEEMVLTAREDSIALHVGQLRGLLRNNPDNIDAYSDNIISSESALFELRARKAVVVDSLTLIEQEQVLMNIKPVQSVEVLPQFVVEDTLANIKYIYQSANMRKHLVESDYQNLVKAEGMERKAQQYNDDYVVNIERMKSLRSSYEMVLAASEADSLMRVFDSLDMANRHLMQNLDDTWGFVYDNKSFAYSMVMEILGLNSVLERETELMRGAQVEISELQGDNVRDEILRYRVQKASMVEYESLVASALNLAKLSDSLSTLHTYLSKVDKVEDKKVKIDERLFIVYEPAKFLRSTIYNSKNPIPQTVIYDKGLIFRIYLGSFREKQRPTMFRKTSPISCHVTKDKTYAYYAGGYATLAEAEEAQRQLKRHGFRKPQVVAWSDGKYRNLSEEPYKLQNNYRIIIEQRTSLPDSLLDCVLDAGSSISKVGNDKYVITPLVRASQVDSLEQQLMALDSLFILKREMDEGKYEF